MTSCKDCKYLKRNFRAHFCARDMSKVVMEHSCSYGEKRNDTVLIRAVKHLKDVFPEYQPEVGKVYEAEYCPGKDRGDGRSTDKKTFAIVDIRDKRIVLRGGEFEIVGGNDG